MIVDLAEMKTKRWFKSYPEDVRKAMEGYTLPEVPVFRVLESSAKYYPKVAALIYEPENLLINYGEMFDLCERFAAGLQTKFGVKKGDKVAIYALNGPETAIAIFGIGMTGAVYVACNSMLIKKEVEYQLNDSKATILIVSDELLPAVKEIMTEKSTMLEKVIVFAKDKELKLSLLCEEQAKYTPPFYKYSEVFSNDLLVKPDINPKTDLFSVMYTSGTTSYPKGAMISHFNVTSASILYGATFTGKFPEKDSDGFLKFTNYARDLSEHWDFPLRHGIDWVLSVPPWTNMMGFLGRLIYPVMSAFTIIHLPVFSMDSMLNMIQHYSLAFGGGAPMMIATLLARPDIDTLDLSCIRTWASGGAPLMEELGRKYEDKISGVIAESWTLTEATMTSTKMFANKSATRKWGAVGVPLPYTEVKVVDPETGSREMPVGEEGELIQKGPSVVLGYLNRPEDSNESFKDGWLFTGDLGTMDQDGFFYITGRKKELIKYKGYNIAPRMLEEVIYKHPSVYMAAACGKKDPIVGDIPMAFVQLKDDAKATAEEIMAFVNGQVAPYKKLKEVRFVEKMPLLASGKLNRRELNNMLEKGEIIK